MAEEEVLYDQVESGDPDPLGLRKRLTASKSVKSDPLGLRAKLSTQSEMVQPKAFEIKLSEPTFKSAPAQTEIRTFTDQQPTDELAPIKLQGKARVAHEAIQKELNSNIDVKTNMIRQRRLQESASNLPIPKSDLPKTEAQLDVERLIKPIHAEDLPVTSEDIAKEDQNIQNDRGKAIRLLEETIKKYPEKAKDIQKNLYTIDAFNSLAPDQHNRVPKIEENAKQIEKGNLLYDARSNRLIKPLGLLGSAIEGWKQKSQLFADYDFLKNTENDAAIAMDLEDKRKAHDMDEPIPVPKGKLSEVSQMLGSTPVKPLIGGAVAGLAGPEASMAAGAIIGGREFAKLSYAADFQRVYNELRDNGVDQFEAVRQARKQAEQSAEIGAVTGAAMGLIGGRLGSKPLATPALSNSFKQAAFNVLKSAGKDIGKAGLEGLAVGGLGAAGEVYKNKLAKEIGINRPLDEGVAQQLEGGLLMTVAMAAAIKGGRGITKANYKSLLHGLSQQPEETINAALTEKVQNGEITQKAADETQQRLNDYKGLDKLIPDNVTEEARFKIQDKILKRNELNDKLETIDKAYHPEIKEKIKAIDEDILNLTKDNKEKPIKQESGLSKEQEKDATEFAEELVHEGVLPDQYGEQVKKDPIGFWKSIAQQAQNRDENWKPLSEPITESAVRDQFGETVVDYAKELFPAPELPKVSENVSIIQPGEIKHPETITIKPKEKSTEVVHAGPENVINVDESKLQSRDSGEYGKGFYVSKSELESPFYGKVKSYFIISEGSKILNEKSFNVEDYKKYEIEKNGYNYDEVKRSPEKYGDFAPLFKLGSFDDAVNFDRKGLNEYARERGYDIYEPTNNEMVVLNLKSIKSKENAIRQRSAETPNVVEASGNSPEMGERIPESGKTTNAQGIGTESKGTGQEEIGIPPIEPTNTSGIHVERPATQLSFRGLQEVANEFGYEDVKVRDKVSDIQERKNAEITANEWAQKGEYQSNIDDLLNRIEDKEHVPTAKQRLILEQYLANERQKLRELPKTSEEYDRQLLKVKRIKDIGNIARSEAGAALRLPQGGSLPHPIVDEESAMIAKMEANSVDKLTDQQKAEVAAQVEKYKQAADKANEQKAKLEEKVAKIDAEKEFNKVKSTTKRTKKTAEERIAYRKSEIEAARAALKKLRTGESGLSAVPLPGVRELMAIAPHVKNIMVDLVEQGVTELAEVVKQLHIQFKDVLDGITEKDIHDIISGEYNKPQKTKSELQRQLEDLNYEAKLINQLESLERGMEPKAEKAKRERNQKIKTLRDKIKDFRKQKALEDKEANEFYKEDIDEAAKQLIAIKNRNEKRAVEIKEQIAKGAFEKEQRKSIFDREDIKTKYPKLRKEALNAIAKKEDVQHEFDLALFNDEMAKRNWAQKWIRDFGSKLIHTSKAVMSGIDDSATFVQNGLVMLANPKMGAKVFINHWKDAFSDARFKRELSALHERPDWEIIKNSGLEIVEPHSAASKQVEEAFEKNLLAGKIKIKGEEYQPWKYTGGIFERAFTSMGNNFRLSLFDKRMQMLKDEGKTFESHPKEYKDAARVINELTGRGHLPYGLAQASPYITPIMWAPRLLTSTINTLGLSDIALGLWHKGYYQNLTPMQKKFALYQVGRGVGIGVAVMGAAALGGADVDWDPRSITFGDIIAGTHHYNVFGRFTPVIKTIVQFAMGERLKKGIVQDLDSGKFGAKTRMGVAGSFFRGKLTPAAGVVYDLAEGRNYYTQQKFTLKDVPTALLEPLSIRDLLQGWDQDGTTSILTRFLPAFEGLKVSDERDFDKKGGGSTGGAGATGHITKQKPNTNKTHR